MSQENVEVVRRIVEAFEAGAERGDFEAAWETGAVAEDVEWIAFAELEQTQLYGPRGIRRVHAPLDRGLRGVVGPA